MDEARPSLIHQNAPLIAFFALLIVLFLSHLYPQQAYPLHALFIVLCMFLAVVAALISSLREPPLDQTRILWVSIYVAFLLIALATTWRAPLLSEARPTMVSFVEGLWVVIIAVLVVKSSTALWPGNPHQLLRLVMGFFIVTALLLCLYAIYQYVWGFSRLYEELKWQENFLGMDRIGWGILHALKEKRVFASFGNANVFGGFLAMAFPFLLASVAQQRRTWLRLALVLQIILTCVVLYLTKSRGGILCTVLAIFLTLLLLNKQFIRQHAKTIRLAFLCGIVLAFLLAGMLMRAAAQAPSEETRSSALVQRLANLTTIRERLFYLRIGMQMIPRAPFWGSGLGAYGVLYPQYRIPDAQETKYVHNFAVQLWIETGLIGLLVFLIFALGVLMRGMRIYLRTEDKSHASLLIPLIVAYVVFLLNGLIEYTFYVREIFLDWCLIGGVIIGTSAILTRTAPSAPVQRQDKTPEGLGLAARGKAGIPPMFFFALMWLVFLPSNFIRPNMASFYAYHGDQAVREDNKARALMLYRRAYSWDPANSLYAARVGRTQFDLGEFDAGILKMKRALQLNPYSASLRDELAQAYHRLLQYPEAIRYEQEAVRCYPLHPLYHYHLSLLYEEIGDTDAAVHEAEQALIVESPFHALYENHLKRLSEKLKEGKSRDNTSPNRF